MRTVNRAAKVIDEQWAVRIRELIQPPAEKLLASSVFEIIAAEGFGGSYPSVVGSCGSCADPGSGGRRR